MGVLALTCASLVLTPRGALHVSELHAGDYVYAMDLSPRRLVETRVQEVVAERFSGKLYKFCAPNLRISVTPDQVMIYRFTSDSTYRYRAVSQMPLGDTLVLPAAAVNEDNEASEVYPPDQVIMMSALLRCKQERHGDYMLFKTERQRFKEDANCLSLLFRLYFACNVDVRGKTIWVENNARFRTFASSVRAEFLLAKVSHMALATRQLFLKELTDWRKRTGGANGFTSTNSTARLFYMLLALTCGKYAYDDISENKAIYKHFNRFVCINVEYDGARDKIELHPYEGTVFNLYTDAGNFLVSCEGRPVIVGGL